ncbi:hypothetical protein [Persephonella sp. KM09-Lau-8]|uniref:hypothetical protein n=1 Tax=Persephonella sp. KM09-Lau-8 TaxID=1158345 RepID=UPI000497F893|nr:hypothetical protein [Persephonella sp. KM09-Lau-8]
MKKIVFVISLFLTFIYGCNVEEKHKAHFVGIFTQQLADIDKDDFLAKKVKKEYPNLQIGLIYYDKLDDKYKAVDPRKGFEKLGYSEAYNREVYYYVMHNLIKKSLKIEDKQLQKQLIATLKEYQQYLKEARKTEKMQQELTEKLLKYAPYGLILFFAFVGSGIAYLLFTIAKKEKIL